MAIRSKCEVARSGFRGRSRVPFEMGVLALSISLSLSASLRAQQATVTSERPTVSLTLSQAIELAMQHNRHLRLAQLSTQESRTKETIAKANYFPHISNESSALYVTELAGITLPEGAFGHPTSTGPIPGRDITVGQGAQKTFTSGTGLTQPITQMFKIHEEAKAAEADVRSAQYDQTDAENSISLLVHQLFFSILTQQAHLEAAKQSVAAAQVAEDEAKKGVSDGRTLEAIALEAHAATLDQKQTVLTDQLALDDTVLQMDDALGLRLGTLLVLDGSSVGENPGIPTREEAAALIVEHNPKILSAQQTVEKARAGLAAARDAYIPNITGIARYSYQSGVPFLVHNFGTFGGAVSYDLFDGGSREAKIKQSKISLELARTQLEQTEADLRIQMAAAYDKVEQLEQLVAVVEEAYKARVEASRVSSQQVAHTAALQSVAAKDSAAVYATKASMLEAELGLFLAKNNIQQMLGTRP